MKYIIYSLEVCVFLFCSSVFGQVSKERDAILEKQIGQIIYDPVTNRSVAEDFWDESGDLFFSKNGKQYWLATFTAVVSPHYDYYRVFEISQVNGIVKEVTTEMLGGYYTVGAPNPPYYYEDIDNDGIKDIFVFDHGKEFDPNGQNWADFNVFFKGTVNGFTKTEIPEVTTIKGYYHGHSIGDFDNDGDNDIAFGYNGVKIYKNDGKGNFTSMNIDPLKEGAFITPLGMKFINADNDQDLELLAPPYRDFENPCCRAQTRLLDYKNEKWEVTNFAQQTPWANGTLSGCAQILSFPNKNRKTPDLIFRIETSYPDGIWMNKFYRNSPTKFDTIMPVKYSFADTAHIAYKDPKIADINFDGYGDIFFKEFAYNSSINYEHPVNERLWINDGNNNFNPINFKFSAEANKLLYFYVKTDSIKKYSLFMSLSSGWKNNVKYLSNRLDSLIFPIKNKFNIEICQNESKITQITKVPVKIIISYNPKNENVTTSDSTITFSPKESGLYTLKYTLKNDFFESSEFEITYNIKPKPATPTISIENSDILVSSGLYRNRWYKDGVELSDTTQKIKPISSGIYSVKIFQNSCSSEMSSNFIYIKTSVADFKYGEYIKVYPNPTKEDLTVDYNFSGEPSLNLFLYDSNGRLLFVKNEIKNRTSTSIRNFNSGLYLILIKDKNGNVIYGTKIAKE